MDVITGYVDHIVYHNADNGYTVLNLINAEMEITCVGMFPENMWNILPMDDSLR